MEKRKLIAGIILFAGISVFVVTLLVNAGPKRGGPLFSLSPSLPDQNPSLRFQANLSGDAIALAAGNAPDAGKPNLTDAFIQQYLSNLIATNPNGPSNGTIKLPDANTTESTLEAAASSLSYPVVGMDGIRVSSDGSPETQVQYFLALDSMNHRDFVAFKSQTIFDALRAINDKNDLALISQLVDLTSRHLANLLALHVPQPLAQLHLDIVNLWEWKLVAYQAIAGMSTDPLQAYVAIQELTQIAQHDAVLIQTVMTRFDAVNKKP